MTKLHRKHLVGISTVNFWPGRTTFYIGNFNNNIEPRTTDIAQRKCHETSCVAQTLEYSFMQIIILFQLKIMGTNFTNHVRIQYNLGNRMFS